MSRKWGNLGLYYISECQRVVKPGYMVLKTDANNETKRQPIVDKIPGTIDIIEYDERVIQRFKERFPDIRIRQGDIRSLPYDSSIYDVVLDLSTLDHIPSTDISKAISEYARVLKHNGTLLLFVWTGDVEGPADWKSNQQYYFSRDLIEVALCQCFDIIAAEEVFTHGNAILMEYECIKQ